MCGEGAQAGTSSTCGSYFNPQTRDFSGVPYSGWDFNDGKCRTGSGGIENYNDAAQVRRMISIKNSLLSMHIELLEYYLKYSLDSLSNALLGVRHANKSSKTFLVIWCFKVSFVYQYKRKK